MSDRQQNNNDAGDAADALAAYCDRPAPGKRPILSLAFRQLLDDARLYRRMNARPGRAAARSLLMTILRSRGLWVLETHRMTHYSMNKRDLRSPTWWLARLFRPIGQYLVAVSTKSQILSDCRVGQDVYFSDLGHIICGAHEIGAGSVIHDHCTMGETVAHGKTGRPTIGRNVWIGSDCLIAGSITVGNGATILPGTFLTVSVCAGALVEGNPARVIAGSFQNTGMRRSSELD